jgi:hypothetical protein
MAVPTAMPKDNARAKDWFESLSFGWFGFIVGVIRIREGAGRPMMHTDLSAAICGARVTAIPVFFSPADRRRFDAKPNP